MPRRFSSLGMISFTLTHDALDPMDTSVDEIRAALMRRIADLDEAQAWGEAVAFDDTVDNPEQGDKWPPHYQEAAQAEGWDLFETIVCESEPWREKVRIINRDDEMDVFESDEAALAHVVELAAAGNEMHKQALRLHMTLIQEED